MFQAFRSPHGPTETANRIFLKLSLPAGPYNNYNTWFWKKWSPPATPQQKRQNVIRATTEASELHKTDSDIVHLTYVLHLRGIP